MQLLYRYVDQKKGWQSTTLEKEKFDISCFYDIEEAEKRLMDREILLCGVKIIRLFNGVV